MIYEADMARHLGLCDEAVVARIRALVRAAGLPFCLPRVTFSALWRAMQQDKKVSAGTIYCAVLANESGRYASFPWEKDTIREWFDALRARKAQSEKVVASTQGAR